MPKEIKLCACGCGEYASPGKTWIRGHRVRIQSEKQKQVSSEQMKKRMQDPEYAEKMKNILRQRKGENHPLYGKNHSEGTKQKMKESALKRPPRSEETKRKISENNKRMWAEDPEYREKMSKMLSENSQKIKEDPKYREIQSEVMKEKWQNGDYDFRIGLKMSDEQRRKLSKAKTGTKLSEETKIKLSISHSGPNHYNWKGGITCEPYCNIWSDKEYKEMIRERDNYICQNPFCNKTSSRLCIHHIDYNKKNCELNNLITVCNSCNVRANQDREFWQSMYSKLMNEKYPMQRIVAYN